eukprot:NODE_11561_length_221_cov_9.790698_g10820_i0.p1 GENE.NODE_11561_length_221_cov_9.790698_g10820_i0~~NODE_11561_length_221_cov_9.790698_g10820_i0.p1  ORF type:complete len:50 (-),score=13.21 NODE_11561_length_221_cov_9.790698_g10820_i0:20-169(-)
MVVLSVLAFLVELGSLSPKQGWAIQFAARNAMDKASHNGYDWGPPCTLR